MVPSSARAVLPSRVRMEESPSAQADTDPTVHRAPSGLSKMTVAPRVSGIVASTTSLDQETTGASTSVTPSDSSTLPMSSPNKTPSKVSREPTATGRS